MRYFLAISSLASGWARDLAPIRDAAVREIQRRGPSPARRTALLYLGLFLTLIAVVVLVEARTAVIESLAISRLASRMTYAVEPGPSDSVRFPQSGPFDRRRGYSQIGEWTRRLETRGYRVVEQARLSRALVTAARLGLTPPYDEPTATGLVVRSADGDRIYDARPTAYRFESYDQIPPTLVHVLLYLENRELGEREQCATSNPAVEWDRLAHAALSLVAERAGLPVRREGGSTLAVQIEKYRHSENGRTESAVEKLRQLVSASLRAYRAGPDTREERRRIVMDYLNTIPLAAAPRYGEVHGVGEGLRVWFALDPTTVYAQLRDSASLDERARALEPLLALLYSVRAPSRYLVKDHALLEQRVAIFADLLARNGVIEPALAARMKEQPLVFAEPAPPPADDFVQHKAIDAVRRDISGMLGVPSLYDLDRLHLEVQTTLDDSLQRATQALFAQLADSGFVRIHGLVGEHLLGGGDPAEVIYGFHLVESNPSGERVLVHADNLDQPFDVNDMMRMELGSTAKLRTLVHYLEIVEQLHAAFADRDPGELAQTARTAPDPITGWAAANMAAAPGMPLDTLLARALERRYSASPYETFFTGSGQHTFQNFDDSDNGRIVTVREALVRSVNLAFVRLMRDVVRYHQARLPYDAAAVMTDPEDPVRRQMLREEADRESQIILARAFHKFRGLSRDELPQALLGTYATPRRLATLFLAWHGDPDSLGSWLAARGARLEPALASRIAAYSARPFTLLDYAYLLGVHPLELWCAGALRARPDASWPQLLAESDSARAQANDWLLEPKHFHAQNVRLRARVERDAFEAMTPAWRRLGFPFDHLVPSLATAIGSSADRPEALAELMGILVNDGVRRPQRTIAGLRFASDTPYHTVLAVAARPGERVLSPDIARTVRGALAEVVERGTATRLRGAFLDRDSTVVPVGAKTGSGDNRFDTFARGGRLISSRAVSRTAAVVFYLGDRHYGVLTAAIEGPHAGRYHFTSALPLGVLKLLAPEISHRLFGRPLIGPPPAVNPELALGTPAENDATVAQAVSPPVTPIP